MIQIILHRATSKKDKLINLFYFSDFQFFLSFHSTIGKTILCSPNHRKGLEEGGDI